MKEAEPSGVLGTSIEATDAPVVTSIVPAGSAVPASRAVESVIEEAFDTHARRLKAFAAAAVRDDAAADDLVQECFVRLVRVAREGRVPDNVGGWLFRVCANLVTSRGRHRTVAERVKGLLADRATAPSPEDLALRSDEQARVREALAELPADARVGLLMAAEGFSSAEIGDAIGRSPGATATYICRARIRLRERLASVEDNPR